MDGAEAPVFYDDETDFVGYEYLQDAEFEYEYEETERETLWELYQYCLQPTIYDTVSYMLPLLVSTVIFRVSARSKIISQKTFHVISFITGLYTIQHYAVECLYILVVLCLFSYAALYIPTKYGKRIGIFIPPLFIIGYCELSMSSVVWHKVRSLIMTMAMKTISVAADKVERSSLPDIYSYMGYTFCGATCLFGPWVSLKDYLSVRHEGNQNKWWILETIYTGIMAFIFLTVSNCWTQWCIMDNSWKWIVAYRDALSFRMSHYFVSYIASTALLLGGFPASLASIVKPFHIEFPRSLVQVVISWNVPMHFWLKTYIFRPGIKKFSKLGAVTLTYLISALLHGLNFQLAAVLLSLGFYTYVEFQLRLILANTFDACIASKNCVKNKCSHTHNAYNTWWVFLINLMFSGLSVFHLAYLGLMFDTSELQETGYSYIHTIEKWSQLDFASHWVVFATYCIYFLIR